MSSRAVLRTVLPLMIWALSAAAASAQGVGAIAGTVTDASGAVLPGAAVTLTSAQGTVGGNQETITDERGAYQFLRLVPGTYSAKAVLQGFRPYTQAGITVNSDQTARADARLDVGGLEEGIVVSGEAPLLDTSSALRQTVLTQEVLESLPNRMDVWSITRVIPSIIVSKVDVGGSESFLQSGVTVRGTDNEGGYYIDGMDVSSLDGEGDGATMYLDPYAFAESNFLAGSSPAEAPRGGLVFNMVTKTGTNQVHGGMMFSGANRSMGFDNYSNELRSQLLATLSPAVLAIRPDIKPGADINYIWDAGMWLAGPIVQNKLWYSTTYHYQKLLQYFLGSYNPDGTQTPDDHYLYTTNNKISWQVNRNSQFSYYFTLQRKVNGHRLGGSFADSRASNNNNKYPTVHQTKWTSSRSSRLLFDASSSVFLVDDRFTQQPDVKEGDIARFDQVTNTATLALGTYSNNPMFRGVFLGSVSYFTSRHDIKVGYSMNYAKRTGNVTSTSGMRAIYRSGIPDAVNTYNTPVSSVTLDREQGFYIQDKWRPARKLTLNLGLRFETNYGWMPATCQQQTQFIAAQCFDAINGAPDWKAVNPRFAAVYDLVGDGMTALKFVANRYVVPVGVQVVGRINPVRSTNDTRQWLPQSRCAEAATLGCDRNGDLTPQLSELGPSSGYNLGTTARYADGYDWPNANEYAVEVQRQLPGNVVFTVGYVRREKRNQLGSRNLAVPTSSYIPLTVVERNSGQTVTVYNQNQALRGRLDTVWDNDVEMDSTYNGGDITLNKRLSNRWMMTGGISVGKNVGYVGIADLNNPNSRDFSRGIEGNDVPFSFRMSGLYELPYGVSVSGSFQNQSGFPELTTVSVSSNTVALTQTTQVITVSPRGATRYPDLNQFDVSIRKAIRFGTKVFQPRLDLYNLTNAANIRTWITQLGPTYHRPSAIQRGLLIKAGMHVDF
ncbi:MAG: TonB-dependent receptor [Acidobacteria bacterium]|nr:TonB-dependent receptor [Acidobacteriota bacterium]